MPELLSNLKPLGVGRIKINLRRFSSVIILKEGIPYNLRLFSSMNLEELNDARPWDEGLSTSATFMRFLMHRDIFGDE